MEGKITKKIGKSIAMNTVSNGSRKENMYDLWIYILLIVYITRARLKINRDFTWDFIVKRGVKRGDPLSATLYSLVIDAILKQIELRGNITTRLKQCTAYTDDILLTTRTKQSLLETFQKLKETSTQYGLIVNGQNTKYLNVREKTIN